MVLCLGAPAFAAAIITVDENGNGFFQNGSSVSPLPFKLGPDPGPGGLASVLTYSGLPFAGTQGDVLLTDPGTGLNDVIRFNGNGTLIFYSDNVPTFDGIGDTPSPPAAFYRNNITILEVGPDGANGATFTPLPGQPGFDPSLMPTYVFVSDGVAAPTPIPEPASLTTLLACGVAIAGLLRWTRRSRTDM